MRKGKLWNCLKSLCVMLLTMAVLCACSSGSGGDASADDTGETSDLAENQAGNETSIEETGQDDGPAFELDDYELQIGSLKGPTTIGLLHLMEDAEAGNTLGNYHFTMETDPSVLTAAIIGGDLDIALIPANLAAVLYNRTNAGVAAIEINTLGVLECVSADESIEHISDLAGKTVLTTGQGATPEYAIRYLLAENNITDCTLEFHSEATEIAALLKENPDQIAVLPQPFATSAVAQNDALSLRFSLTDEWNLVSSDSSLLTGVTVVRTEILEEHPVAVAVFMEEHASSVKDVNLDAGQTVKLIVEKEIIASEAVATAALPRCGVTWITGTEMETLLSGYLKVLYDADPSSVGGTLPTDDFYYDIIGK